jgi:hypothetical protein
VKPSELTDERSLTAVRTRFDNPVRIWDEGWGPLWVYRETLGVVGVVRARTWEEAHECVVDEIMCDADLDDPDNQPDEQGNLPEGLHWRSNGVPSQEGLSSPLAAEDLNGSLLDALTDELAEELGLQIEADANA